MFPSGNQQKVIMLTFWSFLAICIFTLKAPTAYSSESCDMALLQEQPPVLVFTASWCPHCKKAINYLNQHQVQYAECDIEKSAMAQKYYNLIGGNGLPTFLIGSMRLEGFDQSELDEVLFELPA